MKKFIVFISVLVLTLSSFTIQVYATEIENGNIFAEVTPPVSLDDVHEITVLGTIADMITNNGVNFDFSDFTGSYDDFINYIFNTIENASFSAQNFVQEQLQTVGNNLIEWVRNTFTNRTNFGGASNYALQMFNIASQLYPNDEIETNPDTNYLQYIDDINGNGFWWKNFPNANGYDRRIPGISVYPPNLSSWYCPDTQYYFTNTASRVNYSYIMDIQTLHIYSNNGVYYLSHTLNGTIEESFLVTSNIGNHYGTINTNSTFSPFSNRDIPDNTIVTTSGTLEDVLIYISRHFKNVNLYVDNVPWSIVGQETPNKIIYSADNLKYRDTNTSINVNFPTGTYLDYDTLKQIIEDIINNKDVLTYNDIQGVFVDYNGQQAIATYQVNYLPDDDTINIMYPTQPNFEQFDNDMTEITGNTSGVFLFTLLFNTIPPEVWGALCAGALIVLFACLIKRMLE